MKNAAYHHQPVLLKEVIDFLKPDKDKFYIDCTLGGGGHAVELAKRVKPKGKILGIDLDDAAIEAARIKAVKEGAAENLKIVKGNYRNLKYIAEQNGFASADGILLDLGISSGQLQDTGRGFSFLAEGKLDMRFDQNDKDRMTAYQMLNKLPEKELAFIFRQFGEEPLASEIAGKIIRERKTNPVYYPRQLVGIISRIYARRYKNKSKTNPATKIFQALRIAVNSEFENLAQALPQAVSLLDKNARLAVISYHSLEDRTVKSFFNQESRACICPLQRPTCTCQHLKKIRILTKKPVIASAEEITENIRSRSAKLRVAQKI